MDSKTEKRVLEILAQAKLLAREYYKLTGKPLGVTSEVAEFEYYRILRDCKLEDARTRGYDATRLKDGKTLQIKGRVILPDSKPGQRMGAIDVDKPFHAVVLVLLDENFDATEIYEAEREPVVEELERPGSKARNERGQLGIAKFKQIAGEPIWTRSSRS